MLQFDPYGFFLMVAAVLLTIIVPPAWRRQNILGNRFFAFFVVALIVWMVGYGLELILVPQELKLFWARVQYFGITTAIPFWVVFLVCYSGRGRWVNRPNLVAMFTTPAITVALVWFRTELIWQEVHYVTQRGSALLTFTHGPWFSVHTVFSYAVFIVSVLLVIDVLWHSPRADYIRGAGLFLGMLIPFVANILYVLRVDWLDSYDITPLLLTGSVMVFTWSIFQYSLFDHRSVAHDAVVDGLPDSVVTLNHLNHITSLNPAAERLFGRKLEEVRDLRVDHLLPSVWWHLLLATPLHEKRHLEVTCGQKGKVRWFDYSLLPISADLRRLSGRLIILRDITQRKEDERALRNQHETLALRVADRTRDLLLLNDQLAHVLRTRDEFLAGVSHELRTPLNGIIGTAEVLQEGVYGELQPRQHKALQRVRQSGNHLLELISDLLDLSRLEAGEPGGIQLQPVAVQEVSKAVLQMVYQQAVQKNLELVSAVNIGRKVIMADQRRLRQILINLLGNAIKFTPEGGKVGLGVFEDRQQGLMHFIVWDTGIGIAPEHQSEIFRPFRQLESGMGRRHDGVGLGLALSQRLAQLHGGSIRVQSHPGKGSRFVLSLPFDSHEGVPSGERLNGEKVHYRRPAPAAPLNS